MWRPTDAMGEPAWPSSSAAAAAAAPSSSVPPPALLLETYPLLAHVPAALTHDHELIPAAPAGVHEGLPAPDDDAAEDDDQEPAGGQEIVHPLPMGFRFCPTDRVLVLKYLLNKVRRQPTPADIILDIGDIYKFDADQLPRRFRYPMKDECYFYTMRTKKYPNGSRPSRSTPSGYWKATGRDADVVHGGVVVGMRKSLVFYFGRSPAGQKTNWLMHEFRINEKLDQYRNHAEPERDRYVLCKVYKKDEPRDDGSREAKHWAEGGNIYAHNSIIPSRVDAQF